MDNGRSVGKMEKFFAGKGYYIVLALCLVVIGASVWSLVSKAGGGEDVAPQIKVEDVIKDDDAKQPALPVIAPSPTPSVSDTQPEDKDTVETIATDTVPTTWVWPVVGKLDRGYCVETLAYDVTMKDWRTHDGVDVIAQAGAVVRAAADGTVESIENDDLYGTTVTIKHGGGIKTVYSNLAETPTVSEGDTVRAGDVIGSVGDTALCEIGQPTHLHLAMTKDGISADPTEYLPPQ